MSRTATNEYIGAKRRAYAEAGPAKRRRILDEVCETTGYSRKYANRLLTGSRKFRERKGRGATYTDADRAVLERLWREVGCPCTTYLRANVGEWLREYRTCVAHVPDDVAAHILSMSASTMDRLLRGAPRERPGSVRRNRRSGRNGALPSAIECRSGELVRGCDVPPGDVQTDTVAHCGGDMGGDFWWTLTATDRKTQWTELRPVWNRGMYATRDALDAALRRFPFEVRHVHHDNGREYVNAAVAEYLGVRRKVPFSRSRPFRKNDNAHVEQKNGSVVRTLFGESRLDRPELERELVRGLLRLPQLLRPLQDARRQGEAPRRQGLRGEARQPTDAVPARHGGRRRAAGAQGRPRQAQGRHQRHRAPPPRPEAAQAHPEDAGRARRAGFPRPRPPGLGALRRHPFGDGPCGRGRDAGPTATATRGSVRLLTNAMRGYPVKECPCYLTNWEEPDEGESHHLQPIREPS